MENPADTQPAHVRVFGAKVEDREWRREARTERRREWRRTHPRHASVGAGIVFIAGGAILLLNSLGAIPWEFWRSIAPLWPLIIISLGLRILIGDSIPARLLMLLLTLAALAYVIVFGLLQVHSPHVQYIPPRFVQWVSMTSARLPLGSLSL